MGPLEFKLFAFSPDYASFPSGHATNIFAFATVIAMLWPKGRVLLYTVAVWIAASRVLIGQHYFTDVVAGAILGTVIPYIVRERFAARRWLFERVRGGGYRIRGARTQAWLNWPGGQHRSPSLPRGSGGPEGDSPEPPSDKAWDWS
jgi:membrane-associated phospholipid phosphatase